MPTIKQLAEVQDRIDEIKRTATGDYEVIIHSSEGGGVAENRNACLKVAKGEYIIFVDDDLYEYPLGWNEALVGALQSVQGVIMVGPRLLNMDGGVQSTNSQNSNTGPNFVPVRVIPGACMAYRKNDLVFDEGYKKWGWEDPDFQLQLKKKTPGNVIICNTVKIKHKNEVKNMYAHFDENKKRFISKWGLLL